ncbi:putative polysaccharide biosynthesis protein [Listeria fleischmannii]|uniref:putative polysaccharide biosynthesis protein n=1 Tax=Listeria fleischmannii TaxID=1069827 RepID=UPI000DF8F305|nr:polysaccharide biosynthesis protein [Listeria fleischmannii]STY34696.1 Probable cell division protein ytgP [Listeria fleischmannii subsp. coloradonensis]
MSERSIKNLMRGAMWLTIASLISKILSAVYRVPFQNMVGDVGFYIFQQVYPLYGIAMTLALGGFPVVISKMMAEAEGDYRKQQIILQSVYRTLRTLSILLFLFLFIFAYWIASLMGDVKLVPLVRTVSFVFLLTPQLAFLRGYFQGQDDMIPTAISQTVEQLIRVGVIIIGAWLAIRSGQDLYTAGSMAMSGAFFGGLAAVLILRYYHKKRVASGFLKVWGTFTKKTEKKGIAKAFLVQSLAFCTVSAMLILFQLIDSFQVYRLMIDGGIPDLIAKALKGVYDRGQPILQLGLVISTGLALALVPMITAARISREQIKLKRSVFLAMKLTLVFSGAETVGLIVIMRPLNQMLFETSDGTLVLQVFMPAVFLSSLIIMMSSILQGFGKIAVPAIAVLIGGVIKCIGNAILVPRYATLGASLATCMGLLVILILCYLALKQNINVPFFERRTILNLVGALFVMCVIPVLWEWGLPLTTRIGSAVQAIFSAVLGGAVFLIFALRYKLLVPRDFTYLPFGAKLLWLSQRVIKK